MIHALDKKKAHLVHPLGEDTKVASIIGLLKNLPSQLFWQIIMNSCSDNYNLPQYSGELLNIEFWSRGWKETNRVEPDVFIQFQEFDLIIEAKNSDLYGQEAEQKQWIRELKAYFNAYYNDENSDKKVYLIALGGNDNMFQEEVSIKQKIADKDDIVFDLHKKVNVFKSNWFSLLNYISMLVSEMESQLYWDSYRDAIIRLLDDVILAFNLHGIYDIEWFDSMIKTKEIKEKSLTSILNWETSYGE